VLARRGGSGQDPFGEISSLRRREFLSLGAGLLLASGLRAEAQSGLEMLEISCPPRAFDEIRRNLSQMQAQSPDSSDDTEFLRRGRAWLGGPQVDRSGPQWLSADGVPVFVVRPQAAARGVILHMHGGGWVMGNAVSDRKMLEAQVERTELAVVSVDYRLAPEHPYPAAVEDCLTAVNWLLGNAPRLFGCSGVAIQGCSAGAHLAATTLVRLGPRATQLKAAVLYYGVYDLGITPGARLARDEEHPDLSTTSIRRMIQWFTPGLTADQRRAPGISPFYASVQELPPSLMLVGGGDILVDDTLGLAQRWSERNSVQVALFPGAPHGFNMYQLEGVEDSLDRVCEFLARLF